MANLFFQPKDDVLIVRFTADEIVAPEDVDEVVAESGFIVEANSDLLAHPDDDHTRGVFDPTLRGDTDRFILRLRKPE